jgi:hypothetical protein
MKPTKLTEKQWHLLKTRLTNDYSPSVTMIRSRMRDKLGFTPRTHTFWSNRGTGKKSPQMVSEIHLDWFNDAQRTMFMLKYSEYFINDGRD